MTAFAHGFPFPRNALRLHIYYATFSGALDPDPREVEEMHCLGWNPRPPRSFKKAFALTLLWLLILMAFL